MIPEREYELVGYNDLATHERHMLPQFDSQAAEDEYRTLDDTVTSITAIRDIIREVTAESNWNTDTLNTFLNGVDVALIALLETPERELNNLVLRLQYRREKRD